MVEAQFASSSAFARKHFRSALTIGEVEIQLQRELELGQVISRQFAPPSVGSPQMHAPRWERRC